MESAGAINYAIPFTQGDLNCQPLPPEVIAQLGPDQYAISPACLAVNSLDDRAFSSGGSSASTVQNGGNYWLPSLNLRIGLGDDWFVRFAASRAMSKPDIGLLKNFMSVNRSLR